MNDPYWCTECLERHVVPSIARTHEAKHAAEATQDRSSRPGSAEPTTDPSTRQEGPQE